MKRSFICALALLATVAWTSTCEASVIIPLGCVSVSDPHGCLYAGDITTSPNPGLFFGSGSYKNAENAYNAYNNLLPSAGPDIHLTPIISSTDPGFSVLGTITGTTSGTWSLPGYDVDFFAVKAGHDFVLYKITPASSGTWDTFDIPYLNVIAGGKPFTLSHIVFFGSPAESIEGSATVPEPQTWLVLLVGFLVVGTALRMQNAAKAVAA